LSLAVGLAFASLQTSVALLATEPDFWSIMRIEHTTQPAGGCAAPAPGPDTRSGLTALPQLFTAVVQLNADWAVVMLRGDEQIVANHS
jgi:hypothetical protein